MHEFPRKEILRITVAGVKLSVPPMTEGRHLLSIVNCKFLRRKYLFLLFYRLEVLSQVNVTLFHCEDT